MERKSERKMQMQSFSSGTAAWWKGRAGRVKHHEGQALAEQQTGSYWPGRPGRSLCLLPQPAQVGSLG